MELHKITVSGCGRPLEFELQAEDGFKRAMQAHVKECEVCRHLVGACGGALEVILDASETKDGRSLVIPISEVLNEG